MKTFSMTHVGQRRETNQDYMYTSETSVGRLPDLFLVADGWEAMRLEIMLRASQLKRLWNT